MEKKSIKQRVQESIANQFNQWFYFNEIEDGKQVRKRRCLKTMLVQRLEEKEVWVFITE